MKRAPSHFPDLAHCRDIVAAQPHPLVFVTISGAHLYGFASADSDYDLRGVHILPTADLVGLDSPRETIDAMSVDRGVEIDLVTHEVAKFMRLMLKKNGYVLEQLLSPLIVHTSPAHDELKAIARSCITRFHAEHYLGFLHNQWGLTVKQSPPKVKPLLYCYRIILTGIHLMRTGELEANLVKLNEHFRLPQVPDLIARKTAGPELGTLADADLIFHRAELDRLEAQLRAEAERTPLPENSFTAKPMLNDLLLRLRGVLT